MKLHLGCGPVNLGEDWVHVDGYKRTGWDHVDYIGDVGDLESTTSVKKGETKLFGLAEVIYASHVLQYFDWTEAIGVLSHWHRWLAPGGRLLLAVPDFRALADAYVPRGVRVCLPEILGPLYGRMKAGSTYIFHKTAYDYELIASLLRAVDFHRIRRLAGFDWAATWKDLLGLSGETCKEVERAMGSDGSWAVMGPAEISLNVEAYKRA